MKCPKCGREIQGQRNFCPYDGTPLNQELSQNEDSQKSALGKVRIALVVILCLIVVVSGIAITWCVSHSGDSATDTSELEERVVSVEITADGSDHDTGTPIPLSISGTTSDGEDVSETVGVGLSDEIDLAPGSYELAIEASPLTQSGVLYQAEQESYSLEVHPDEESYEVAITLNPINLADLSSEDFDALLDEATTAAGDLGVEEETITSLSDATSQAYESAVEEPAPSTDSESASGEETSTDTTPESTESSFVQTARAELGVPDDPSITYEIGSPYYWEGAGITVTPITFYKDGVVVASADCTDDGSPATTILGYPGLLGS